MNNSTSSRSTRFEDSIKELGWAEDQVSSDPFVLEAYGQDLWPRELLKLRESGPRIDPNLDGVVWPLSTDQVVALVKWVKKHRAIVIPYGAGSGVCGGTLPEGPLGDRIRIIVDLKKMRQIRSLDRKSLVVDAEAGWIGENLERALNQEGYTLGHFPSSIYCSSLGGYLAARSAGQLSTKYGKIEDMVVSLETVLPDGTLVETGRAPRSAMGPDWTQLLLGSEGTLCIFTSARLQIHPLPEVRIFQSYAAPDMASALKFAREMVQKGARPAVLRIYDPLETSLALNGDALKEVGFPGGAAIIVVFEGSKGVTEAEAQAGEKIAAQLNLHKLGPKLGEHWWDHRYDVSYKQQLILSHDKMIVDTFEIAATWANLENVYELVKKVRPTFGVILAHSSHFYHTGANIYFSLVCHAGFSKSSVDAYDQVWEDMLGAALKGGASLSHHHGVGKQKVSWLKKEKKEWAILFERLKRELDPEGCFNPGKMGG